MVGVLVVPGEGSSNAEGASDSSQDGQRGPTTEGDPPPPGAADLDPFLGMDDGSSRRLHGKCWGERDGSVCSSPCSYDGGERAAAPSARGSGLKDALHDAEILLLFHQLL